MYRLHETFSKSQGQYEKGKLVENLEKYIDTVFPHFHNGIKACEDFHIFRHMG